MRPAHPAHTIGPAASATLLSALSLADAKLAELRSRRPLSAPALRTLREELRLQTTYDSNAIEGSKLTLQETVLVVQEGFALKGARLTDLNAAVGFARAWAMLLSPGEPDASAPPVTLTTLTTLTTPITPHLIRSVHQIVMLGALPQHCGVYRNHDVRNLGTACETAPFVDIPRRVDDLTRWVSSPEAQALHPIERTERFHLAFETIHRFADGNGRTGRLLLSLMLSQGELLARQHPREGRPDPVLRRLRGVERRGRGRPHDGAHRRARGGAAGGGARSLRAPGPASRLSRTAFW